MREQVPTSLTTIDAIMNTREFALGVPDGRAGRGYRRGTSIGSGTTNAAGRGPSWRRAQWCSSATADSLRRLSLGTATRSSDLPRRSYDRTPEPGAGNLRTTVRPPRPSDRREIAPGGARASCWGNSNNNALTLSDQPRPVENCQILNAAGFRIRPLVKVDRIRSDRTDTERQLVSH